MPGPGFGEALVLVIVLFFVVSSSLPFAVSLIISLIVGAKYGRVDLGVKCGFPMAILSIPTSLCLYVAIRLELGPPFNMGYFLPIGAGTGLFYSVVSWRLIRVFDSRDKSSATGGHDVPD